ncbi:MAG: type I restriction endonuclease subunit M, partial [Candidatus Dadabacteria bacterium]|nr:type I restriction endonuclease subunit M [Candidatus Dadabacteria bacterium]
GIYCSDQKSMENIEDNIRFESNEMFKTKKWTGGTIGEKSLNFIYDVSDSLERMDYYCSSRAGIVTAANSFFILSLEDVHNFNLKDHVQPIIQKALYVNGGIDFSVEDFDDLKQLEKPCFLLDLNETPESEFSHEMKEYLRLGKKEEINRRYKCKLRDRWFDIPSIEGSDGFFFKRSHLYPKLLSNSASVYVTDSAYRVKMNEGFEMDELLFSFYNSLTLVMAELTGRSYGGGVLELTPTEFKQLPLPYCSIDRRNFQSFKKRFKRKSSIDEILMRNDAIILGENMKLSEREIASIQEALKKIRSRRLRVR